MRLDPRWRKFLALLRRTTNLTRRSRDLLDLSQGSDHWIATFAASLPLRATAGLVPVGPSLFGMVAGK
jgi:hypothetical protein